MKKKYRRSKVLTFALVLLALFIIVSIGTVIGYYICIKETEEYTIKLRYYEATQDEITVEHPVVKMVILNGIKKFGPGEDSYETSWLLPRVGGTSDLLIVQKKGEKAIYYQHLCAGVGISYPEDAYGGTRVTKLPVTQYGKIPERLARRFCNIYDYYFEFPEDWEPPYKIFKIYLDES